MGLTGSSTTAVVMSTQDALDAFLRALSLLSAAHPVPLAAVVFLAVARVVSAWIAAANPRRRTRHREVRPLARHRTPVREGLRNDLRVAAERYREAKEPVPTHL